MACLYPRDAYYSRVVNPSGKRSLTYNRREAFSGIPFKVPCRKCSQCRLGRAAEWAARCMKEAQCHEHNSFITLTYSDDNLPSNKSLDKAHFSAFFKKLHNRLLRSRGVGIRFYGAGEYSPTEWRPHYHALIFGFDFPDKVFYKNNSRGEPIYRSDFLREVWPEGLNGIGAVTFESAAYTAGYVTSKVSVGANSPEAIRNHYLRYDDEGRPYELEPEDSVMSRMPGIGRLWFDKYYSETYRDDNLRVGDRLVRPPRYFDNLYGAIDSDGLSALKVKRRARAIEISRKIESPSRTSQAREAIIKSRLSQRRKDVK